MSKPLRFRLGSSAVGHNLAQYLARAGYMIHADCGGRGTCGKCRIRLEAGYLFQNAACTRLAVPDKDGYVLACQTWGCSGAIISLPDQTGQGLTDFADQKSATDAADAQQACGIALDIGTTTLAAALVDLESGCVLDTASALNPQASFGADVISRIDAVMRRPETLTQMQSVLLERVRSMLQELAKDKKILRMVVAGNPTMLHVFCGISPAPMGAYPFTPAFTNTRRMSGAELQLPVDEITVLPGISAFVGADITAGMLQTALTDSPDPVLLVDIGTNGESVLFTGTENGSRLFAASAAAGPAMEGAGISSGMGGVRGAVCAVRLQGNTPVCTTVDHAPAQGICGSGLIDLAAALYKNGILDETGAFTRGDHFVYATAADGTPLSLTQADVRALQLAKSAIRASLEALCAHAGLTPDQLDRVYLAGGLGYYMNVDCATLIGLLPCEVRDRVSAVGNAALGGCVSALHDPTRVARMQEEALQCKTLELSTNEVWNQAFLEHMMFPDEDEI